LLLLESPAQLFLYNFSSAIGISCFVQVVVARSTSEFSRATDLSTTGVAFYVLFGLGGAVITCWTWLIAVGSDTPPVIRRLLATAAISSLLILVMTVQAAPLMWRVGSSTPDPALISNLLDRFTMWTVLRVACADVSFLAVLSAFTVAAIPRSKAA